MKSYRKFLAAFVAACCLTVVAFAADTSPTGTWKWSQPGRGDNPAVERSLNLEHKDGMLTGMLKGVKMGEFEIPDTAITNASYKDGTIAFTIELEFNGNKFVSKYQGKLAGNTITGSTERPGRDGGAARKTDWTATRAK